MDGVFGAGEEEEDETTRFGNHSTARFLCAAPVGADCQMSEPWGNFQNC